jgi:hypothetical protein
MFAEREKKFIMPRYLLKKLGELLLPERMSDNRNLEPLDILRLIYQENARLAEQIESHAELAPYPQVAQRLRRIADEKRDVGERLRKIVEDLHGSISVAGKRPATGKNHWQRLIRDLEDQRAFDDLLGRYESENIPQIPGGNKLLDEIKRMQDQHRQSLIRLIAVADPQASQT